MANPNPYTPSYSFSGWQTANPEKPLPAPQVDNEFANVSLSLAETISAIEDIRRSDGALKNGIVTIDSFSPSITLGFSLRGAWTLGVHYLVGDGVFYAGNCYRCQVVNDATNANRPNVDPVTWTFLYSTTDLAGAMSIATYDPTGIGADVFNRANHYGPVTPSDNSVTTAKLAAAAVTADKIGNYASRGHLVGLTLSNNASAPTNGIDIAAGEAASSGATPYLMTLAAPITKRLDAAWAPGSNAGGLDTGVITNGTYHLHEMQRSDTGVVDVCFSASAIAPTVGGAIPATYDRFRRIGSVLREGGALVAFKQDGNIFRRATKTDRSSTSAVASALLTLSIPTGINIYPLLSVDMATGTASTDAQVLMGGAWEGSAGITITRVFTTSLANTASVAHDTVPPTFLSNTAAQIYFATIIASGSISANVLATIGWIDGRGIH